MQISFEEQPLALRSTRRSSAPTWIVSTTLILRLYWVQDRVGVLFMAFHAAILPILVFYFAFRVASGHGQFLARLLAGGMASGAGIGVISAVGYGMLADVQLGRLALLSAAGVDKVSYYAAHLVSALALGLLSMAFGLGLLSGLGIVMMDAGQVAAAVVVALTTGAASCGLGALVAAIARDLATGRESLSLASAGLAFLSPVFYREADLPLILRALTWASPFTHAANLDRAIISGSALPMANLVAIVAIAVVLNVIAFRRLRWS